MGADGRLEEWAELSGRRLPGCPSRGFLHFVFCGRVSTGDWQDPESSLARQRAQARALVRGHGQIVAEFFDAGESRTVACGRRPQAAALVAQLADPCRGWDAIVIGEYDDRRSPPSRGIADLSQRCEYGLDGLAVTEWII